MRRLATLVLAVGCAATPAARAEGTKPIETVVVAARPPGPGPTVWSSYPTSGAIVPAGVMILKVVFDQPMKADEWAYAPMDGVDFPKCLEHPRELSDARTFVLLCTVAANRTFALEINPTPRFASAYGRSAKPFRLQFTTTDTEIVDLHDALKQAGLADADDPIMTEHAAVQGVSQNAPAP
jgi:hypothetical protein